MHFEDELRSLIKDRADSRKGWSPRCPGDLQLAAYVDGKIDGATRQSLQRHLSDCRRCLDEVSFLVRAEEWPSAENAPGWLVTRAEELSASPQKKSFVFNWRWATATAAVSFAVILFVVFAVRFPTLKPTPDRASVPAPEPTPSVTPQLPALSEPRNPAVVAQSSPAVKSPVEKREPVPLTRNARAAGGLPNLLSPREGSSVRRDVFVCRWQKVPDAAFYEISIMSASGDVLVSRQTETESLDLAGDLPLQTGAKYFMSVRAHLRDGRTIRSTVVSFHVVD